MAAKGSRGVRRGEANWRRIVKGQPPSGLSIRDWCKRHGITEASFYAWRRRLLASRGAEVDRPQLMAVEVTGRGAPLQVIVEDVRIEVSPGFDVSTLQRLLAAVRERAAC